MYTILWAHTKHKGNSFKYISQSAGCKVVHNNKQTVVLFIGNLHMYPMGLELITSPSIQTTV